MQIYQFLLIILVLYLISCYYFTRGFFLTKYELNNINENTHNISAKYDQLIYIIIDGLRFDFTLYNDTSGNKKQLYENN